jgi:citrate synthase
MIVSLSTFYPELSHVSDDENINVTAARLLSKIRTIAAFSYKKSIGEPFVYPRHELKYCLNFLNMMFHSSISPYVPNDKVVMAFEKMLILHADHEQNCSTSAVRLVGSAQVNLYAAIAAGVCALWGPLHGGANQAVIEMLESIHKKGESIKQLIRRAKDKNDPFRMSGFGHRIYKNYDPRATILKKICDELLTELQVPDPLFAIAQELEQAVMQDDYFIQKKLYPNVDFYSGIILRAIGIPTNMFTVIFAIGRLPGWIAQWKEAQEDPTQKIYRPRQIYIGPSSRSYVPISKR